MGVSSSESHDLTAFYEMLTASFGILSQNTGFYPSLDRIVETTLRPLNLGPGGRSYNKPISRLHHLPHIPVRTGRTRPPPPPVEIDGNIEYEVSEILNSKLDRHFQGNRSLHYLVCWSRYEGMEEETSWVSAQDLEHAQEVIGIFHHHYLL